MKPATLILALSILMQIVLPVASAIAQEGCPNICPEGMVWSHETGKCEPYKPLIV
jgi:hypothetical protein